jgi:predicted TIM-barrel fold metal-dependent hydrolase
MSLGYPWVRETLMLGKGFPNVWLNLCWTHIIAQKFAEDAMSEAIELVPSNKILAFGADYGLPVEKVYGHLIMARENIARAFSPKIESGQMSIKQAVTVIRKWLRDNPKELYRL